MRKKLQGLVNDWRALTTPGGNISMPVKTCLKRCANELEDVLRLSGTPADKVLDELLDAVMEFAKGRRQEYAEIAAASNRRGLEIKKLSAECRELAYFDVMKEIERVRANYLADYRREHVEAPPQ